MTIHVLGAIDPTTHYGLNADRVLKKFDDSAAIAWAYVAADGVVGGEPLAPTAHPAVPECRRVVLRSGCLNEEHGGLAGSWGWSPRGKAAFDAEADRLAAIAGGLGFQFILWPRVGDVLSDIPSCLSFLRRNEAGPFRLMIEPAALLDESMLPRAAEHLERIVDSFAEHSGVVAFMASNVQFHEGHGKNVPLSRGLVPRGLLDTMISRLGAAGNPLVVLDRGDAAAIAGLWCPA